ncbi:ralA-binding protein 1-like [Varroa jacobsoni]|uniref:Rho-GAP domain-containing protein n=1 Tax=Varroa destructor TaxID=109461 RepID=A0A7M7L122_VARDE|nr:ralA-binding protein 1-like [Varroa destructor]XP_022689990.1 ralA-binding protein 1-like [Varroa jacobsoni]
MDFDSPEAEQDFPGLYTEDKIGGDDESRKILSVKKKKDKDKDKGYKAFEEDGSGGSTEDLNKGSSSRRFKFGKSSSKSSSKPVKVKLFGVELKDVVQRNPSDEPKRPLVPRFLLRALNYLEREYKPGMNFYKGTSHYKSKIHVVRHGLNYGEELPLQDPQIVAGLVKLFVRELPCHILGAVIESKLEEARPSEKKAQKIQNLYKNEVSGVNRAVFERLVLHMDIIGIDLTPLLRVSQRALALLKPVMSPLSVEDELKVEEARLARMHAQVATKENGSKDKTGSKDTSKHKDNEEKLWEAQRNVTQLKRKLKQMNSVSHTDDKEVELNLKERIEDPVVIKDDHKKETFLKKDQEPISAIVEEPRTKSPAKKEQYKEAYTAHHNSASRIKSEELDSNRQVEEKKVEVPNDSEQNTVEDSMAPVAKSETEEVKAMAEALDPGTHASAEKISPVSEPKHDQILQPVPVPPIEAKPPSLPSATAINKPLRISSPVDNPTHIVQDIQNVFADTTSFDQVVESFQTNTIGSDSIVASTSPFGPSSEPILNATGPPLPEAQLVKPEALTGKPLEDAELRRIQQEWRFVLAEQVELLRMNHDLKRRIRDEYKQIKMIQMVRNHKSRLSQIKPMYHDPLEKIPTDKLCEVLQRLIESNTNLTNATKAVAAQVFDEKLAVARARALERCISLN